MDLRGIFQLSFRTPRRLHLCLLAVLLIFAAELTPAQTKPPATVTPTPTPEIVQPDDTPIRVDTDLVTLTLTVADNHGGTDVATVSVHVFCES